MTSTLDLTVKFDAFAAEHESLERALDALRVLLARRQDAPATIEAFAELSDHVKTHFVHEEQDDGFFENVIEQAPRLEGRAAVLIQEHAAMADALKDMQLHASQGTSSGEWWSDLSLRFEAFWKLFCLHERAEIDLVQEAFQDDIGACD